MLLELVPYFATEEFRDANGAALDRARATYDEFASMGVIEATSRSWDVHPGSIDLAVSVCKIWRCLAR